MGVRGRGEREGVPGVVEGMEAAWEGEVRDGLGGDERQKRDPRLGSAVSRACSKAEKMQDSTHRDLVGVVADDEAPVADGTVSPPVPLALFPLVRIIGKPLRE